MAGANGADNRRGDNDVVQGGARNLRATDRTLPVHVQWTRQARKAGVPPRSLAGVEPADHGGEAHVRLSLGGDEDEGNAR